jgi:hypothetical protein
MSQHSFTLRLTSINLQFKLTLLFISMMVLLMCASYLPPLITVAMLTLILVIGYKSIIVPLRKQDG